MAQTISMKSILIVFFIVVLIMLIMFFPFKVRMMSHTNLIELNCFYCFKLWRLKFLCGMAKLDKKGEIEVENSNNLFDGDIDKLFAKKLVIVLMEKINVKKIELFFSGGFVEDSYTSALVCGGVTSIVKSLYGYFSQRYDNVKMYEEITPTFHETNLELTFDIVISVSIAQVLSSVFKANKQKNKILEEQNEG